MVHAAIARSTRTYDGRDDRRRGPPREDLQPAGRAAAHGNIDSEETLHFAGWRIDLNARLFYPSDVVVALSDGEFRLLRAFTQHPRRVRTRDQLLDHARGSQADTYDRAIDVRISRLRRKPSSSKTRGEVIRTVRSEGCMSVPAVTRAA